MRRVESIRGIFFEASRDDPAQRGRGVQRRGRELRRILDCRIACIVSTGDAPVNARLAGQHLVEHRAEREDVGARVGLFARGPARATCSRRVPITTPASVSDCGRVTVRVLVDRLLGETEVENLDASVGRHEQVGWLDVAVRDALFVRRREAGGDLPAEVDRLGRGQRPGREPRRERLAFQELGDEVRRVVVRAEIEDGEDVRMIERARRPGLAHEALQPVGISGEGRRQDFDRDVTIEARVPGPVDLAHAPLAERRDDLVGAEPGAGADRHQGQIVACRAEATRRS